MSSTGRISDELFRGLCSGIVEYCGPTRIAMLRLEADLASPIVVANEPNWSFISCVNDPAFREKLIVTTQLLHKSNKPAHDELNLIRSSALSELAIPPNIISCGCYS